METTTLPGTKACLPTSKCQQLASVQVFLRGEGVFIGQIPDRAYAQSVGRGAQGTQKQGKRKSKQVNHVCQGPEWTVHRRDSKGQQKKALQPLLAGKCRFKASELRLTPVGIAVSKGERITIDKGMEKRDPYPRNQ